MGEVKENKTEKNKKGVKKEFLHTSVGLYTSVGLCLLVGFLGGVVFTVFSMPDGCGVAQHGEKTQAEQHQHNLTAAQQMVEEQPGDSQSWTYLGHAYFDLALYENAIAAYTQSLSITPDDRDVMTDLGVMYRRNGQSDEALDMFAGIIDRYPDHEPARFNKGIVLFFDKGDKDVALQTWRRLLELNPASVTPNGQLLGDFILAMEQR